MPEQPIFQTSQINQVFSQTQEPILLLGHTHPDGDTVGSGLALRLYLQMKGKKAYFILPNPFPNFLAWLPGSDEIIIFDKNQTTIEDLIKKTNVIVFVDMNALNRLEQMTELLKRNIHNKTLILFDHHPDCEDIFHYKMWDANSSSTSEMVYKYIEQINDLSLVNKYIAENLYTGIMTDTGSFSYSCNNPETYIIVSNLVAQNIDVGLIHQKVYNTFTENRLRLFGLGIYSRLNVMSEYGAAYIALSSQDLKNHHYQVSDTEGLVNYTLLLKNVNLGILITEMEQYVKISLRSVGNIDVNAIAKKFFNGGGHKNAAGAYFYGTLEQACQKIEEIIRNYIPNPTKHVSI